MNALTLETGKAGKSVLRGSEAASDTTINWTRIRYAIMAVSAFLTAVLAAAPSALPMLIAMAATLLAATPDLVACGKESANEIF